MRISDPFLILEFLGNDLTSGHETTQTIDNSWIVNHSITPSLQLLNGLKSSSNQFGLTLFRNCPAVEDIIATEGNIKAILHDGETTIFTGFISTSYSWTVTDHGESALAITIESIGTRLFSKPFIEFGYHFFDTTASAVVYQIINPLGLSIKPGDERKLLQPVRKEVEAGKSCRELLDSLFYECNAVYTFNNIGQLCVEEINADTSGASTVNSEHLYNFSGKAISLSKSLRTYKGARVRYSETASAENYLVYRNTTSQDSTHPYCNLKLGAGEWYDGGEIYTAQEWTDAMADQFREPTLISAVNAASESSIVGSGKIIAISNAQQMVVCESGITVQIEAVGGKWFKITAHNTTNSDKYITRMDLFADIVYERSQGVIRTQIIGSEDGKSLLEEEMTWIHDKDNAQRHANLLAQYYRNCGASYTFYSDLDIDLGSVIKLNDDVFSGLEVYVLVYASKATSDLDLNEYKAVGITTFDLDEPTYHGTTQPANQSGAQGPAGEPGATAEIQYAIGSSITDPPMDEMQWGGVDMEWASDVMLWQQGLWGDEVPDMERGKYIWMRSRTGDAPWQYTRLTGSTSWDAENLGVATEATPTTSKEGLGLIPGDYFIVGSEFTEDGVTYRKGFAYYYTGSGWAILDLSDPDNSDKALQCLSDLMTSGVNVTDSTASIYGWFQNLVAQNAVIDSLVAELATIKNLVITGNIFNDVLTTNDPSAASSCYFLSSKQPLSSGTLFNAVAIADIEAILGVYSISRPCTGTITVDGVTYTGTKTNPIDLRYIARQSLSIRLGSTIIASYGKRVEGSSSYLYSAGSSYYEITANTLYSIASGGSITVHDVIPEDSTVDKVGSEDAPFNEGWFKSLHVTDESGFYFKPTWVRGIGDFTMTDSSEHNYTLAYDNFSFMSVSASFNSGDTISTGLFPVSPSRYASGKVMVPKGSGNLTEFAIISFDYETYQSKLYYKCAQATSSTPAKITFNFYR